MWLLKLFKSTTWGTCMGGVLILILGGEHSVVLCCPLKKSSEQDVTCVGGGFTIMLIWQDSGRFKRNSLFFESFALEQLA